MDDKILTVPYIAYESMLEKEDRQQKRMVIVILFLTVLLIVTNVIWMYEWEKADASQHAAIALETENADE